MAKIRVLLAWLLLSVVVQAFGQNRGGAPVGVYPADSSVTVTTNLGPPLSFSIQAHTSGTGTFNPNLTQLAVSNTVAVIPGGALVTNLQLVGYTTNTLGLYSQTFTIWTNFLFTNGIGFYGLTGTAAPAFPATNGSLCVLTNGQFYLMTNNTWTLVNITGGAFNPNAGQLAVSNGTAVIVGGATVSNLVNIGTLQSYGAGGNTQVILGANATAPDGNTVTIGAAAAESGGGDNVAVGAGAQAGGYSTAVGYTASAAGTSSTALGKGATASASTYADALGDTATASGNYAVALGSQTTASGIQSLAAGFAAGASALNSTALGEYAHSIGPDGVAVGQNAAASNNAVALGTGTSAGTNSIVIGENASATNTNSTVIGPFNTNTAANTFLFPSNQTVIHPTNVIVQAALSVTNGSTAGVALNPDGSIYTNGVRFTGGGGAGAISSVTAADTTVTVTPTTGAVTVSAAGLGTAATNYALGVGALMTNMTTNLAAYGNTAGTIGNGVLNVRNFGVKGDGSADDTAALQHVFNLVYTNGGNCGVYLPPGVYKTSATLTFPGGNTQLYSDGQGAILRCSVSNLTLLNCGLAGAPFTNGNSITVRNIVFDNTAAGRNCLEYCGVTNGLIDNCYFLYPGYNNIQSGIPRGYGCWLLRLDDSSTGPSHPCVNVTVQNCTLYGCSDAGYEPSGAINCAFIGNHAYNCYSGGTLYCWNGSQGCRFIGNDIWGAPGNTNSAIKLDIVDNGNLTAAYQTNFQTTGNIFSANYVNGTTNGIFIANAYQMSNNVFEGNIFANVPNGLLDFGTNLERYLNNIMTGTNINTNINNGFVQDNYPLDYRSNEFLGLSGNGTNWSTENTGYGLNALIFLSSGGSNTAMGWNALSRDTTGGFNTAVGYSAGSANQTGNDDSFFGWGAGGAGSDNSGYGYEALNLVTGNNNSAFGSFSQRSTAGGADNTSAGQNSLEANSTGNFNTAIGFDNEFKGTGSYNTSAGAEALQYSLGSSNIAVGFQALQLLTNGFNNIMIGNGPGITNGSSNIYIGNAGPAQGQETNIGRVGTTQTNFYFPGQITATNLQATALTSGSIVVAGTGGTLLPVTISTGLTYTPGSPGTLTAPSAGGVSSVSAADATVTVAGTTSVTVSATPLGTALSNLFATHASSSTFGVMKNDGSTIAAAAGVMSVAQIPQNLSITNPVLVGPGLLNLTFIPGGALAVTNQNGGTIESWTVSKILQSQSVSNISLDTSDYPLSLAPTGNGTYETFHTVNYSTNPADVWAHAGTNGNYVVEVGGPSGHALIRDIKDGLAYVTGNYSALFKDRRILAAPASGAITVTLPNKMQTYTGVVGDGEALRDGTMIYNTNTSTFKVCNFGGSGATVNVAATGEVFYFPDGTHSNSPIVLPLGLTWTFFTDGTNYYIEGPPAMAAGSGVTLASAGGVRTISASGGGGILTSNGLGTNTALYSSTNANQMYGYGSWSGDYWQFAAGGFEVNTSILIDNNNPLTMGGNAYINMAGTGTSTFGGSVQMTGTASGIQTVNTNVLTQGSTAYSQNNATLNSGYTNASGINAVYHWTGTSGTAVWYWEGGASGLSPVQTNTIVAGGGEYPLANGCGVQIVSGVSVSAVVVFKP